MRKIRLEAEPEYSYKCEFKIIDSSDGPDKQRGKITVDYGMAEIDQLKGEGLDLAGAMEHYRDRIYFLVKVLISSDWECTGGMDEALSIISKYIERHFND